MPLVYGHKAHRGSLPLEEAIWAELDVPTFTTVGQLRSLPWVHKISQLAVQEDQLVNCQRNCKIEGGLIGL